MSRDATVGELRYPRNQTCWEVIRSPPVCSCALAPQEPVACGQRCSVDMRRTVEVWDTSRLLSPAGSPSSSVRQDCTAPLRTSPSRRSSEHQLKDKRDTPRHSPCRYGEREHAQRGTHGAPPPLPFATRQSWPAASGPRACFGRFRFDSVSSSNPSSFTASRYVPAAVATPPSPAMGFTGLRWGASAPPRWPHRIRPTR